MIIVKIMAGLGNQLFQYACARALAQRLGVELGIWRDVHAPQASGAVASRPCRLLEFNVRADYASDAALANLQHTFIENPFTFHPSLLGARDNTLLDGFWQSEAYFADAKHTIRAELEFKDPQHMEQARAAVHHIRQSTGAPVVAVHVRRGDYVEAGNAGIFHNLSLQWYQLAMSRLPADVQFLVCSDDIPWCRDHLTGPRVHYSQATHDLMDLALMRACDGYIIANSSFSWWAAWLSDQENPVVIAPTAEQWFGSKLMQAGSWDAAHIVPMRWLRQPDLN